MNSDIIQNDPYMGQDELIKGVVRVVKIEGTTAWVESETQSACGSCAMSKGCGTKVISGYFDKNIIPLVMLNDFDGVIGDRIEVGISNAAILKVSALIYLLPLMGMVAGAILGESFNAGDIFSVILSVVGLSLGFLLSRIRYSSDRFTANITPIFLKKLERVELQENIKNIDPVEVHP
ncbi:MAG: SoxR reducing system RseC family protein [Emcibacter sp.]|nr:SoxR reducing system RseC family protein [Emcibacter sp.]